MAYPFQPIVKEFSIDAMDYDILQQIEDLECWKSEEISTNLLGEG